MMERDLLGLLVAASAGGGGVHLAPGLPINWLVHPQGEPLPAVVLNIVSGAEGYTMQGRDGLLRARVQVDAYAHDLTQALVLGGEIEDALSGFRGAGADGFFEGVFLTSVRMGREGGANEAERPFRRGMDFEVNWRAT
jgi:hypothetical protein